MKRRHWLGLILALIMALAGCAEQKPSAVTPDADILGQNDLVCLEYSSFSGEFIEDGSGRAVQNVAAMLIRNDSGKFLDYALVTCQIGTGTGTFKVTGLPAGESAWVLEQNGKTLAPEDTFAVTECKDYAFRTDAVLDTDKLSVTTSGNTVTVTNISDETLEKVCIYYKTVHSDGNYFGGISFMLGFDTLAPNQSLQKQSSHFGEASCIVRYSFQTQK